MIRFLERAVEFDDDLPVLIQVVSCIGSVHNASKATCETAAHALTRFLMQYSKTAKVNSQHAIFLTVCMKSLVSLMKMNALIAKQVTSDVVAIAMIYSFYGTLIKVKSIQDFDMVENSDSETEESVDKSSESIRLSSLHLIAQLSRSDSKTFFGFWYVVLPTEATKVDGRHIPSLLTVLSLDPSSKCRSCASLALGLMFGSIKPFLLQIDDGSTKKKSPNFPMFAFVTANMVKDVHSALFQAIKLEKLAMTLSNQYNGLSIIFDNTTYSKLKVQDIDRFLIVAQKHIVSKEKIVLTACCRALTSLFNKDVFPDLNAILSKSTAVLGEYFTILVKSEQITKEYTNLLLSIVQFSRKIILSSWFGEFTKWLSVLRDKSNEWSYFTLDLRILCLSVVKSFVEGNTLVEDQWRVLFDDYIQIQRNNISNDEIIVILEIISSIIEEKTTIIGSHVGWIFDHLKSRDVNIVEQACKTIGVMSLREGFAFDPNFLQNAFVQLDLLKTENEKIRQRVSWAISNVSEALTTKCDVKDPDLLFKMMIRFLADLKCSDHIRQHSIRGIGYIGSVLPREILETKTTFSGEPKLLHIITNELLDGLLNESDVKMLWNTCHAIGKVLSNPNFVTATPFIEPLSKCLENPNFKVRIAATTAICSFHHINDDDFSLIINLLKHSIETDDKFSEYLRSLKIQVKMAVSHLVSLIDIAKHTDAFKRDCEFILDCIRDQDDRYFTDKMIPLLQIFPIEDKSEFSKVLLSKFTL